MRVVGIILVALGLLGFGWQGFAESNADRAENGSAVVGDKKQTLWVPPVVSGIAVVSGLILLASHGRREEL